jgi:hypothetical protein
MVMPPSTTILTQNHLYQQFESSKWPRSGSSLHEFWGPLGWPSCPCWRFSDAYLDNNVRRWNRDGGCRRTSVDVGGRNGRLRRGSAGLATWPVVPSVAALNGGANEQSRTLADKSGGD